MTRDQPPDRPPSALPPDRPALPDAATLDMAQSLGRSLERYHSYVSAYGQHLPDEGDDLGLSSRQLCVLFLLRARGTQNVSALARSVNLTLSAMSHLLERLVQRALVVRREDPGNRRQKQIALTEQGQRVLTRLDSGAVHAYALLLLRAPAEVLHDLQGCLRRLDACLPAPPGELAAQAYGDVPTPLRAERCAGLAPSPFPEDHP